MTAQQVCEAIRSGAADAADVGQMVRRLAREAAGDRDLTGQLFRDLVEPLSDSFRVEACRQYAATFSEAIAELAPEWTADDLRQRYARITAARRGTLAYPRLVFILSRVTLGADIAVTSVLMDAAKQAFPRAQIAFTGNRKNADLWAADPRVSFREAPYDRGATLQERIDAFRPLKRLLEEPASIVIDPDSRLTQLGLIPVCDDNRYFLFESRAYGGDSREPLSALASEWAAKEFGVAKARAYIAPPPVDAEPRVTVSFGVGENPAKRAGQAFEIHLLQQLMRLGARVLVDQGAGGEEAERVQLAVDQTAGLPGQVQMFRGPFAEFAAHIARSPLYVGYDSAGQHAAAALGVPRITIFAGYPSERFLDRWRPAGDGPSIVLRAGDPDLFEGLNAALVQALRT